MNRGEKEGILKVRVEVAEEPILQKIERQFIPCVESSVVKYVRKAIQDSYQRFIKPVVNGRSAMS